MASAAVSTANKFRPASQIFLPSLVSAAPQKPAEPAQNDGKAPVASTSSAVVPLPQFIPQHQLQLGMAPPAPSPPPRKNSKTPPAKSGMPGTTPGADPTRKYICEWDGCGKAYTKPARLHEHYRSHTDERPYVCNICHSSYRRETHLSSHMRSHKPESERPLECTSEDCTRRFWTKQQLRNHVSTMHDRIKQYECDECEEAFAKAYQLRAHVAEMHHPEGTLPNICEHPGCGRSFAAPSALRTHAKSHEAKTYACGNIDCITKDEGAPIFNTWSALQKHIKAEHPPVCPHEECDGQLFANTAQLRKHLKMIHKQVEQVAEGESAPRRLGREEEYRRASARKRAANQRRREIEEEMGLERDSQASEDEEEPVLTDRDESDAPEYNEEQEGAMHDEEEDESDRDMPWHCVEDQCERSFATAAQFHAHVLHDHTSNLSRKTLACTVPACTFTARKQHALDRHLKSAHREASLPKPSATYVEDNYEYVTGTSALDMLTGHNYGQSIGGGYTEVVPQKRAEPSADGGGDEEGEEKEVQQEEPQLKKRKLLPLRFGCPATAEDGSRNCEQRFWRVYDVERHLKRNHGMNKTRAEVESMLDGIVKAGEAQSGPAEEV